MGNWTFGEVKYLDIQCVGLSVDVTFTNKQTAYLPGIIHCKKGKQENQHEKRCPLNSCQFFAVFKVGSMFYKLHIINLLN